MVAASGNDPVKIVTELGDRVLAVHVKDGPVTPNTSSAQIPTDQVPAGQGDVPLAAAIAAATSLQYAVVEFDQYAGDSGRGVGALTMARTLRGDNLHIATGRVGYHVLDAMASVEESAVSREFVSLDSTVEPIVALPEGFDPFAATLASAEVR